ncbi:MAG: hypothetical protein QNJ34_21935 [Xenococcaceae cyanobacterium MO_188.B29]|nr:hypothetical protein [Xenococcaceae cyanobacterium MO_188.B29]
MFRNQYLIVTNKSTSNFQGISPTYFHGLHVYTQTYLNTSVTKYLETEIFLIGYIIDPQNPEYSNQEVIDDIVQKCPTEKLFFPKIQTLSGRYILIYKNKSSFIVTGDACNLRQIYFNVSNNRTILTSSVQMFLSYYDYDKKISQLKKDLINNPIFQQKESAWYGNKSIDDRLSKLLPNHYLDLHKKEVKRIPLYSPTKFLNENDIIDFVSMMLKGTFASLVKRYKLVQALTSGLDSRILLAAAKEFKDDIQFYVFNHSDRPPYSTNVWVSQSLAQTLKLNHAVIKPDEIRPEFLQAYKKEHVLPRILHKTSHIQYFQDHYNDPKIINISGNASAMSKCHYGYTDKKISLEMLLFFSGHHSSQNQFIRQELAEWLTDATQYSEEYGIAVLDLFYWEQRQGNWGALQSFEKDIAIEEVCPFNNTSIHTSILQVKPSRRSSPDYKFFKKLLQSLWTETLLEPINPDNNKLKGFINTLQGKIKRHAHLKYTMYQIWQQPQPRYF